MKFSVALDNVIVQWRGYCTMDNIFTVYAFFLTFEAKKEKNIIPL
jgi:hypothetical protein